MHQRQAWPSTYAVLHHQQSLLKLLVRRNGGLRCYDSSRSASPYITDDFKFGPNFVKAANGRTQGNRASKALNDRPQEVVAPARFFELPAI